MQRKFINELIKWKALKENRMPLLIYGARQVGKTWIIKEFGKQYYKNVVYVNFEKDVDVIPFFEGNISPNKIIKILESYYKIDILEQETLIIFDEIQVCNRALTSLKYFAEETPQYNIIGAGSLLGVAVNTKDYSFPVGKVIIKYMYPLDFEEFLMANKEDVLIQQIKEHFMELKPLPEILHNKAMQYYKLYNIIGGMPAVVVQYISNIQGLEEKALQTFIINSYINDMTKYATASESIKIIASYNSIPVQLAKDNKKFQYKLIQKGGNASIFGNALEWLIDSGVVLKCIKTEALKPLNAYIDFSSFKLYMSDIGLLTCLTNIDLKDLNLDTINIFKGGLAENYVACMLKSSGHKLYYWTSSNTAEVDFVLDTEDGIIPVEVKANLHSKSKSLEVFKKRYNCKYAIRISGKNFGFENNIKSIPLYATFLI